MPQSLAKVYLHITFSTKNREKRIDSAIEDRLYDYLGGICKGLECFPVQIGGYQNHVHLLCTLSRKTTLAELLEALKKNSSKWIKSIDTKYENFYWQRGYGVFSVNPSELDVVKEYIINQHEHHRVRTFEEEYRAFLKKYKVDFDERYLWD